jgi:tetratricopeptide (TPR) repeat protein
MITVADDKIREARSLCAKSAWPEVLAYAQQWHQEVPTDAKAFFYQGVALAATGRFIEAETKYRRALELDPDDFKTWNNLGGLLFESMGRTADGAQCLAQALKLDPGNKLGWANLASMHGQLGHHEQALECAERALALDSTMVEAQLHRARAAQILKKPEIVEAACKALAKIPANRFKRTR